MLPPQPCFPPAQKTVPQPATNLLESAPALLAAPAPAMLPSYLRAWPNRSMRIHTCPLPAFCSILPAAVRSGISAATSDYHAAPVSYKSGWPAWHLQHSPAAQTTRPAAGPPRAAVRLGPHAFFSKPWVGGKQTTAASILGATSSASNPQGSASDYESHRGRPSLCGVCPVSPVLKGLSLHLGESIPICYRSPCLVAPPLQRSPRNKPKNRVSIIN